MAESDLNCSSDTEAPELSESTESNRKKEPIMRRYFLIKILYKAALIFLGYAISYMQWSVVLLFVAAASLIWLENRDKTNVNKIKVKAAASSYTKQDLIKKIDEIPSWVKFPDRERAEWLNQVIAQFWPTLNNYIVKIFRGSIQNKIRKKYESFRFESIDFGCNPPKIDGIKVYNSSSTKDSIIIDFEVFYDGNCDINFSVSGAEIGGLRDFQLSVEVRVVLKPLLLKLPLIGGVQVYFLNTPDLSFTLDGLSSIPGLSSVIRSKIEEKNHKVDSVPQQDHQEILQVSGTVRIESFGTGRSPASTCFRSEGFDGQRHHRKIRSVRYSDRGGRRTQNQHRQPESQSQMGLLVRVHHS
jgi:Ca2+-dependent lipid-binding protein